VRALPGNTNLYNVQPETPADVVQQAKCWFFQVWYWKCLCLPTAGPQYESLIADAHKLVSCLASNSYGMVGFIFSCSVAKCCKCEDFTFTN